MVDAPFDRPCIICNFCSGLFVFGPCCCLIKEGLLTNKTHQDRLVHDFSPDVNWISGRSTLDGLPEQLEIWMPLRNKSSFLVSLLTSRMNSNRYLNQTLIS